MCSMRSLPLQSMCFFYICEFALNVICYQTKVLFIIFKRNIKWKTPAVMYVENMHKILFNTHQRQTFNPMHFWWKRPSNCKDKKVHLSQQDRLHFAISPSLQPYRCSSSSACLSVLLNLFYLGYPLYLPFQAPHSNGHETNQIV